MLFLSLRESGRDRNTSSSACCWPRKRLGRAALAGVAAAVFLVTGSALAAFSGRTLVSPADQNAVLASTGVDADGNVLWAWGDFTTGRVAIRSRAASGVFSTTVFITTGVQASFPVLAMNGDGEAVIVWLVTGTGSDQRLQARSRSPSGALGPVRTLTAGPNLSNYNIGIDEDGDALIVWQRNDGVVLARPFANGNMGAAQTVATPGTGSISQMQVAMAANGVAQFAWLFETSAGVNSIRARTRSATGSLAAIQVVADGTPEPLGFRMAVDATGDALFGWNTQTNVILARTRSAAGGLGPVRTLITGATNTAPVVASNPEGDGVVMWNRTGGVQGRLVSSTSVVGPVRAFASVNTSSFASDAAGLPDGRIVLVWRDTVRGLVRSATRLASGTYTAGVAVSPAGTSTLADIAVGASNDAVVTWTRQLSGVFRVEATFGP